MRKTLQDVAAYLKEIMVPGTQEAYEIKAVFINAFPEEDIRKGVAAFRVFLERLYDVLYIKGELYDNCKKIAHEYENRTTLSVYYPFLYYVSLILMKIGYRGVLDDTAQALTCGPDIFHGKLSAAKNLECLRFLTDCGIDIEGIDLSDKKQNLSEIKTIKITYPQNPIMLTGMKVMASAEIEHGTLVNQDVFLRCDYGALKKEDTEALFILQDTIRPLSSEVQKFLLELHQHHLKRGLSSVVEIKGFHIYIKYSYRRKDVWGINASLNNGYHINVKSTMTQEYTDSIKTFATSLQELIAKGYGCGRKREIGHCDGGCRGLPISLDDSVLELQDDIRRWLDLEVSCLQKRK